LSNYGDGPLNIRATSNKKVAKNVSTETSQTGIDRTDDKLMPSEITKAASKTPSNIDPHIADPRGNNNRGRMTERALAAAPEHMRPIE
jgi:hypothetical protein